ncbi:MAG: hypothetical protein OQJ93_03310 [Ignavibacteriaceae bacterium]|nr:hypothetical protein [Ignavibacteriaceae bacterium]
MDNKKGMELIKLEVLGCINEKDRESLLKMKEADENFPWKVLAEYQNLIALLPLTLPLIYPDSDLKDKTATKLYKIRDEIKAKLDAKKPKEVPNEPLIEETPVVKETVLEEVEEGVQFKGEELHLDEKVPTLAQTPVQEKTLADSPKYNAEGKDTVTVKSVPDRELIEKITRDYFKSYIEKELEALKQGMKKNRLLSLAFFLFTLVLIVVLYFIG